MLPLVTPNMHSFAPNHSTVRDALPQSISVTGELQAKVNSINGNTHRLGPRVLLDDLKGVFLFCLSV